MEKLRIQKYISDCGIMSRRAAENAVLNGEITVNGAPAVTGMKIDPDIDMVEYNGKTVKPLSAPLTYIMLNKPRGYVTTVSDEQGRKCVIDLVSDAGVRVYPIGRLDMYSEGLLLLTNDGELTNKLTHPRHEIPKIYEVKISGKIDMPTLRFLNSEMEIDGYIILPVKTELISETENSTAIRMTLYEGRNRQIRKMCEKAGLRVQRLKRVAVGELKLSSLPLGKWRRLTEDEISYLKN